ncbi:MAG: hydroxypyruvate isomerase family protein [Pirellulales bacterium]
MPERILRRDLLQGLAAGGILTGGAVAAALTAGSARTAEEGERGALGGIRQSIVYWCFHAPNDNRDIPSWDIERMCEVAVELGCKSIELAPRDTWETIKKFGLTSAIVSNGSFRKGFNNPRYHDELVAQTTNAIDAAADAGFPSVITFTGFKWRDADDPSSGEIPLDEAAANCVAGLRRVIEHAEKRGVTICIEHLNSRDSSHPMKGHPGYQGDDIDWLADVVRQVGSDRMKILFDIYHVQIMHGDVMRRLEQHHDVIGHVHTAGNPGRGELDERQEIYYPAIMRKLVELKYAGFVGQEFIPTRDPYAGLSQAVAACDV